MRLFLVELNRFRSRRAIVLLLLAGALLVGVFATATLYESRPVSAQDLAAAQQTADQEAQRPYVARDLERCQKRPGRFGAVDAEQCAEFIVPRAEWFLDRAPLRLDSVAGDVGLAMLILVAAIMALVGTTFAGADWSSGSMSNQLIFKPQRVKVWVAKALAVTVSATVVAAVVVAAFWFTMLLFADLRGITTREKVLDDIAWTAIRGVALAGFAALGGYALTMLLRHTVGTLALMFGYAVAGEALTASLPIDRVGRWSLGNNVFAWLNDGTRVYDYRLPCDRVCDQTFPLTLADGATYLGVTLAAVIVLSVLFFRRRDVP